MGLKSSAPTEPTVPLPGASQVQGLKEPGEKTAMKVDYKAEERARIAGQVRMHCVVAALQSPAGPAFAPTEEAYLCPR
jgi:hypothetical protein